MPRQLFSKANSSLRPLVEGSLLAFELSPERVNELTHFYQKMSMTKVEPGIYQFDATKLGRRYRIYEMSSEIKGWGLSLQRLSSQNEVLPGIVDGLEGIATKTEAMYIMLNDIHATNLPTPVSGNLRGQEELSSIDQASENPSSETVKIDSNLIPQIAHQLLESEEVPMPESSTEWQRLFYAECYQIGFEWEPKEEGSNYQPLVVRRNGEIVFRRSFFSESPSDSLFVWSDKIIKKLESRGHLVKKISIQPYRNKWPKISYHELVVKIEKV